MIIDEDIIRRVRSGDQKAFRMLVEHYQQYAFNLAFRILCNEDEAKDTVQDSFIRIWQKIRDFDEKSKFSTWMYSIVTNKAIDRLRSIKRRNLVSFEAMPDHYEFLYNQDTVRNMNNRELGQLIRLISEELPEKQRIIFILRDIQGMDSQEVQEVLELSESSVKSNLYHARQAVKEKLTRLLQYERREP